MCTSKEKHYYKQKEKTCQLDNLLVLSGKTLPQCTVGDLSVVCTLHQIKRQPNTHHLGVTLLSASVEYKKQITSLQKQKRKKNVLFTLFWLINSTIKSVVYTSYTSVLLRLRLNEPKHILFPNSHGGRNTGVSPHSPRKIHDYFHQQDLFFFLVN